MAIKTSDNNNFDSALQGRIGPNAPVYQLHPDECAQEKYYEVITAVLHHDLDNNVTAETV